MTSRFVNLMHVFHTGKGSGQLMSVRQSAYVTLQDLIDIVNQCMGQSEEKPYDLVVYIKLSSAYSALGYPDLSVGAAYKALLLSDAVQDESDEYHEQAVDAIVYRGSCIGEIDETATEETAIVAVKSIIPLMSVLHPMIAYYFSSYCDRPTLPNTSDVLDMNVSSMACWLVAVFEAPTTTPL